MTDSVRGAVIAAALACALCLQAHPRAQATTGTLGGIVESDERPAQPIRRATVSLIAPDLRVPLSTITDDSGRFLFEGVPPGHYSVVASKPAYVGAFYGSNRPGRGPGVPVAVRAGARAIEARLTLTRGAVITGVLRLPSGELAHNMAVTAVEVETANGVRRLRFAGGRSTTDDRGEYRIFGLPPGEYVVLAQPSGLLTGAVTGAAHAPLTTASEVSWAEERARRQRGGAPAGAAPPDEPARGRMVNYTTVYHPGTADPSLAAGVRVEPGEERRGVDFAMALVETATLTGVVVGPDGQPLSKVPIAIASLGDALNISSLFAPRAPVTSGADGTFSMTAVPPGRYRLLARAGTAPGTAPAANPPNRAAVQAMAGAAAAGGASRTDLWAQEDVVVDGRDLAAISLQMQPGMSVRGRVVFTPSSSLPPAEDLAQARVTIAPVTTPGSGAAEAVFASASGASGGVEPDGTFVVTGLPPDRYRVSLTMPGLRAAVTAPPGGWSLASIARRQVDLAGRDLEIRPREAVDDLVITLTANPTVLRGTLTDQIGQPAPSYPIVVFPADRGMWMPDSRRVAIARPSTDGTFHLIGLPAGRYHLTAVVSVDPADLDDPGFLEQLLAGALTITLREGATVVQDLRLRTP